MEFHRSLNPETTANKPSCTTNDASIRADIVQYLCQTRMGRRRHLSAQPTFNATGLGWNFSTLSCTAQSTPNKAFAPPRSRIRSHTADLVAVSSTHRSPPRDPPSVERHLVARSSTLSASIVACLVRELHLVRLRARSHGEGGKHRASSSLAAQSPSPAQSSNDHTRALRCGLASVGPPDRGDVRTFVRTVGRRTDCRGAREGARRR